MSKELFPHSDTFGYRLEYKEDKNTKVCWFCHSSHLQKYLDRYKPTSPKIDTHPNYESFTQTKKEQPKKRTVKKQKQKLFADVDTYVKVKAPPAAPRRRSKVPKPINVGNRKTDCPRLLQDRFTVKIKKDTN
jgi:hypothetical protein